MPLRLRPGNALGCITNSHRHGWRGEICSDAANWQCGAAVDFRENFCAAGRPFCFHLHLFDAQAPAFVADWSGLDWILGNDLKALDDQILLFWGREFDEPNGCLDPDSRQPDWVFGAYRIQSSERMETGRRIDQWRLLPYRDGWTRLHTLKLEVPPNHYAGGRYVREVERSSVLGLFRRAAEKAEAPGTKWLADEDEPRFRHFHDHIEDWLGQAEEKMRDAIERRPQPVATSTVWEDPTTPGPLAGIGKIVKPNLPAAKPPVAPAPPPVTRMVDAAALAWVREQYSVDVADALALAARTKPLLILRGRPGVGKSHLAVRLLDDVEAAGGQQRRARTLIVPVAATWRGNEHLLGYVNPVTGEFEPTSFTDFLLDAADAWGRGDKRARNVVFEEFNLSQPEHWLSDILVVTEFDNDADRYLQLPGRAMRGRPNLGKPRVYVSPALRFIATINSDHTTRPLSPRVLDRAAVIDLELLPSEAVGRIGLSLEDQMLDAITELDYLLRSKGSGFSIRSARSLEAAFEPLAGNTRWHALDLVLCQELLSKVRLMARDPIDAALLRKLREWSERFSDRLPQSSNKVEQWDQLLNAGLDVVQT